VIWRATLSHLDEIRKEETRIDAEEHTGDRRAHQTLQRHTSHIASPFVRADFLRKSAITQNEKARITVREQITTTHKAGSRRQAQPDEKASHNDFPLSF
jgi:hypothetical protein